MKFLYSKTVKKTPGPIVGIAVPCLSHELLKWESLLFCGEQLPRAGPGALL